VRTQSRDRWAPSEPAVRYFLAAAQSAITGTAKDTFGCRAVGTRTSWLQCFCSTAGISENRSTPRSGTLKQLRAGSKLCATSCADCHGERSGSALKYRFRCKTPSCLVSRKLWKTFSLIFGLQCIFLRWGDISGPRRNRHFSEVGGFAAQSNIDSAAKPPS